MMKTLWENYAGLADVAVTTEQRFIGAARGGRNCFLTGMAPSVVNPVPFPCDSAVSAHPVETPATKTRPSLYHRPVVGI
jgi:hypothetical protein